MTNDFLKQHNLPYPPFLDGWTELKHVRILRLKSETQKPVLQDILDFRAKMKRAGLPFKNVIFDAKKITDIDPELVADILIKLIQNRQKVGLINVSDEIKNYLVTFAQRDELPVFESEVDAIAALNTSENTSSFWEDMRRSLRKHKSLVLLAALVMFIVALPEFEGNATGTLYLAFFNAVLIAGVYAVSYNLRHVAGGVLLATPTLMTAWSNVFLGDQQILNAEMIFLTIFLVYTIVVILMHILAVKKVTLDELFGAICVYIMIGMTFGVIYALLYSLNPAAIGFPPEEKQPAMTAFFYFSFVSMSSTGFSGITALSSLARAVVIVQVIIGVMYVSALIGKLVSANTPDDDGLFDNMEIKLKTDYWAQELKGNFFRERMLLLVLSMAMLNYSSSVFITALSWPFFMDSWGTSLAVVLGGLRAGILSGVIYNLIMALTFWSHSSWVWMFCNILVAFLTAFFLKLEWIDLRRPFHLLMAGVICGFLNSLMVVLISFASQLPIYEGTMAVYHFFVNLTGNAVLASLAEKVAVEVADKTISFFLVAVAIVFVRDYLNWNKKDAKVTSDVSG